MPPAPVIAAKEARLRYVSDEGPGIIRRRAGKGFSYRDPDGRTVTDPETLERIRSLAIPPAWTEVWISPHPHGHIQATGRDAKGRKQYRYHERWSSHRAETKYARVAEFATVLPRIRERVEQDLGARGPTREKILATVVRLLELTLIRVGNKEYARQNRSYGLTTLNKRHIDLDGSALVFHFKGKSGVMHQTSLRDRRLAAILKRLHELPGQQLFKYVDADGALTPIESADVNAYIREVAGEDFSAKDFRTWAGTVSAARALRMEPPPQSQSEAKRVVTRCVRAVSGLLGNTPTVCRAHYVHPAVFDAYMAGTLAEALPEADAEAFEAALISMLATKAQA